jgi:hypothetical protein
VNREPSLDELIDAEAPGAERQRLQHVHELLLKAGPPPELTPELESGPTLNMTFGGRPRRVVKQRAMLLLAAALTFALVFLGGYAVGNGGGSKTAGSKPTVISLAGTKAAPGANASLEVWHPRNGNGNWPMALTVVGLHKLPLPRYYEVYVVRHGQILGSCGTFRVEGSQPVSVNLNAPYPLEPGDTWVVTRQGAGGAEPGTTVLKPVTA